MAIASLPAPLSLRRYDTHKRIAPQWCAARNLDGQYGNVYHRAMTPITLRIRELREAKGWSQRELSRRSSVRQATISAIENGSAVGLDTIERLADALDVDAAVLIVHTRAKRKR